MVKLNGPGLAASAAGGLADTVIFSKSKGRAYLKSWHKPTNRKTQPQVSVRAASRILTTSWTDLTATQKNSWAELALRDNVPPVNAYQKFNLTQWGLYLYPTKIYPPTRTGIHYGGLSITVAQQGRGALWTFSCTIVRDGWSMVIHHVPVAGGAATRLNCIRFIKLNFVGTVTWLWTPLNIGTYHFRAIANTVDGNAATPGGTRSVTIT